MDGHEYRDLLAAGAAYLPLFEAARAGDALGGVVARLAAEVEVGVERHGDRRRRMQRPAHETSAGSRSSESAREGETPDARRTAAWTPLPSARVTRMIDDGTRPSAASPRAERLASNPLRNAARLTPLIPLSAPLPVEGAEIFSSVSGAARRWSSDEATRELASRAEQAGLIEVWYRPAFVSATPAVAVGRPPAPATDGGFAQAIGERLAPALESIARRHPAATSSAEPAARFREVVHETDEHESAHALQFERETPLRRLAAFGRLSDATPTAASARAMAATVREPRASAAWLAEPRGEAVEERRAAGHEELDRNRSTGFEERDLVELFADALLREALRNGIDPLEYES
jgi:hypothetical protein